MHMRSFILCLVALTGLAACETTEGFGRDLSHLGTGIEQEAQKAQGQ